jgi:hypothetical protein
LTAYSLLRVAHGYWRWVVLVSALTVLVRAVIGARARGAWTRRDDQGVRLFVFALDLQVFMGLMLYFVFSPFWPATYHSFHETMSSQVARFFGVEHETAMLLAFIVAHVGRHRADRAVADVNKHRAMVTAMAVFFMLVLWAIPWPWREVGRPLFRTTL